MQKEPKTIIFSIAITLLFLKQSNSKLGQFMQTIISTIKKIAKKRGFSQFFQLLKEVCHEILQCFGSMFFPDPDQTFFSKSGSGSAENPNSIWKIRIRIHEKKLFITKVQVEIFFKFHIQHSQHYPFWLGSSKTNSKTSLRYLQFVNGWIWIRT